MKTVLIVEPNEELRISLRKALQNRYLVYACRDGSEAMSFMHLAPDVLILDLLLSEIDGLTFLERVSHMRPEHVIVITPIISNSILHRLSALGVDAVVRKPCRIEAIVDSVHSLIRKDPLPVGRG